MRLSRIRALVAVSLAGGGLVLAGAVAPPVDAARTCKSISGSATTFFNGTAFVGAADITILRTPHAALVTTHVLSQVVVGGTIRATTSHHIVFDGHHLVTLDRAMIIPTSTPGVFLLRTSARIVEGGSGVLAIVGRLDFRGVPTATWGIARGVVCL